MKPLKILSIVVLLALLFGATHTFAQDSITNKNLTAKFSGEWYNKKEKRSLIISYDAKYNRFDIHDHTKGYSVDVYYAHLKGDKLILPAQNSDHHSSYCELIVVKNQLVYECNSALNFTDNVLKRDKFGNKMVFKKRKRKT